MELSQELIKELFDYKDGCLFWKKLKIKNQVKIGDKAGYVSPFGYYWVFINNRSWMVSRVIFLYHHGYIPIHVDHIDRDKSNNKIENLRPANATQNSRNRTSAKGSSSKYLGVQRYNKSNKWLTCIRSDGNQYKIGVFETEELAALAYNKVAVKYHGEFANLNIITP